MKSAQQAWVFAVLIATASTVLGQGETVGVADRKGAVYELGSDLYMRLGLTWNKGMNTNMPGDFWIDVEVTEKFNDPCNPTGQTKTATIINGLPAGSTSGKLSDPLQLNVMTLFPTPSADWYECKLKLFDPIAQCAESSTFTVHYMYPHDVEVTDAFIVAGCTSTQYYIEGEYLSSSGHKLMVQINDDTDTVTRDPSIAIPNGHYGWFSWDDDIVYITGINHYSDWYDFRVDLIRTSDNATLDESDTLRRYR